MVEAIFEESIFETTSVDIHFVMHQPRAHHQQDAMEVNREMYKEVMVAEEGFEPPTRGL